MGFFSSLSFPFLGKVEKVCEVRRMGEEKAALETVESRNETLVTQQELKKRAVCIRIVVLDKLVEASQLRLSI